MQSNMSNTAFPDLPPPVTLINSHLHARLVLINLMDDCALILIHSVTPALTTNTLKCTSSTRTVTTSAKLPYQTSKQSTMLSDWTSQQPNTSVLKAVLLDPSFYYKPYGLDRLNLT